MAWALFKGALSNDENVSEGGGARKAEPERRGPGKDPNRRRTGLKEKGERLYSLSRRISD